MALFSDSIPKWLYDQKCEEYNALLEKYHALRPTHSAMNPAKIVAPKLDSAMEAMQAGERAVNDPRLAAAVLRLREAKPGLTEAQALREARRLFDIGTGKAEPPAIGPALR